MAILVGVDEAGYGPILGPLVITAVVFEVKDHEVDGNLWQILKGAVIPLNPPLIKGDLRGIIGRERGLQRPLAVADSKRLYSSSRGLRRLEEGVLAFQGCIENIENLRKLLDALYCYDESQSALGGLYPWYHNMQLGLPLTAPPEEVARYRQLLQGVLASRGVKFLGSRAVVISPFEFNKAVEACGNKALLLFDNCAKLIKDLWVEYPQLEVLCDKHGGRSRYAALLSRAFGRCTIRFLLEGPEVSSYELKDGWEGHSQLRLKVSFIPKAEDKHLPVALASMYSKYVRELFLRLFNNYWQEKLPGLKATAGYPKDARRFLKDIDRLKASLRIKDDILIRNR
ncbi:MAG TPA: hypothetical protein ACFYD3_00950 [Candidatus Hypogeohydataceae bacterium YC41]